MALRNRSSKQLSRYYAAPQSSHALLFGQCQHACGIIPGTALCALCRYRHKAHWSGAEGRLNRDLKNSFGSQDYAREEVRAELAQAMVCAELDVACDFPNTIAHLSSWIETLKSDRKEVFRAAADAQRIADYLLAFHPEYARSTTHGGERDDAHDLMDESAPRVRADFTEAA